MGQSLSWKRRSACARFCDSLPEQVVTPLPDDPIIATPEKFGQSQPK